MSTNEIEQLREERDAFKASSDIRGAEVERLRARVSELEQDAAMRGFLLDLRSDLREPAEREGGLFHYFYQRVSEQLGLSALAKDNV